MNEELKKLIEQLEALLANEKLTIEQDAEIDKLETQIAAKEAEIEAANKAAKRKESLMGHKDFAEKTQGRKADDNPITTAKPADSLGMPAYHKPMRFSEVRLAKEGLSTDEAYDFGQWALALRGNREALAYCEKREYLASQTETVAGYLVPTILSGNIILVRQKYGVARQNSLVVPMPSSKFNYPTATTPIAAAWGTISVAASEQVEVFGTATLSASKLSALVRIPNELILDRDSVVDLGGLLSMEIGIAWAKKEDDTLFNGDGGAGYGSQTGILTAINAASTVTAATGHTGCPTLTLADFEAVLAATPYYGEDNNAWYCHKAFWAQSMLRLAAAAGGNRITDIESGSSISFLGYPVRFTQVMDATQTANVNGTQCLFGDMRRATILGDRRQLQIKTSDQVRFAEDETVFLATSRIAVSAHMGGVPVGTVGPMVLLKNAAS